MPQVETGGLNAEPVHQVGPVTSQRVPSAREIKTLEAVAVCLAVSVPQGREPSMPIHSAGSDAAGDVESLGPGACRPFEEPAAVKAAEIVRRLLEPPEGIARPALDGVLLERHLGGLGMTIDAGKVAVEVARRLL